MDDARRPEQLSLFDDQPRRATCRSGKKARVKRSRDPNQLELPLREPPSLRLILGEGEGSGIRRGRLVGLPHPSLDKPLPSREEITLILLQAGADLVAGRISAAGAALIREAAEEALFHLEESERDPERRSGFVRAARALEELCN